MATIKSYTDIPQSKTLSKILPLESADMHYHYDYDFDELESIPTITEEDDHFVLFPKDVRCWSLVALLGVLPDIKIRGSKKIGYIISYNKSIINKSITTKRYFNIIDACYEMILKLNELNLL